MNRILAYLLIPSGIPFGYALSYFWLPATSRLRVSMSDYFSSFRGNVFLGREGIRGSGALAEIVADMQVLAWAGIILGLLFMGALVFAGNKRELMGRRMLWVCGAGLLVGFVSMLIVPGIMERRFMEHSMPPGLRQMIEKAGR